METKTSTSQPSTGFDIWAAIYLMKDGSYAIIIFLLIILVIYRRSATKFFGEHVNVMESLKDSNDKHAEALEKTTKAVERVSKNNTILVGLLAKHFKIDLSELDDKED